MKLNVCLCEYRLLETALGLYAHEAHVIMKYGRAYTTRHHPITVFSAVWSMMSSRLRSGMGTLRELVIGNRLVCRELNSTSKGMTNLANPDRYTSIASAIPKVNKRKMSDAWFFDRRIPSSRRCLLFLASSSESLQQRSVGSFTL